MKVILHFAICFILISSAFGQPKSELNKYFSDRIAFMSDSVLTSNKLFLDTVLIDLDSTYSFLIKDYNSFFRDSVYALVKDSLSTKRLDSLNIMSSMLRNKIKSLHTIFKDSMKLLFVEYEPVIMNSKNEYATCDNCNQVEDFYDMLDEYDDVLDSISSDFQDKIIIISDSIESALTDSVFVYMDSVYNYSQTLLDNEYDETDIEDGVIGNNSINYPGQEINYSGISIDAAYQNHLSYRGRDNGIFQNSFSPSVTLEHSSGLGVSASPYFVSNSQKTIDEFDLSIFYKINIFDNINGTFSYTHYWFGDSSSSAKSVLKNTLSGDLYFDFGYVILSPSLSMDFSGSHTEFNLSLEVAAPLIFARNFLGGELGIEPSVLAMYGEQNDNVLNIQKRKNGPSVFLPGKKNVFSVLDYEISLPLVYTSEYLIFKPGVRLITPLNVIDNSQKKPYVNFSIEFGIPFYFK